MLPIDSKFRFGKKKPQPQATGEKCPECRIGDLVIKAGKWGPFKGCNRYPDCRYIEGGTKSSLEKQADAILRNAGRGDLVR